MPEIRPLRSTLLTAQGYLVQISHRLQSTIHEYEIASNVLSKLLGVILFIAIFSIIGVWQIKFRRRRLHDLQLLFSFNYTVLTIVNNIVRLPPKSDLLSTTRILSLSLLTIVQTCHLISHWKSQRNTENRQKIHTIHVYHTSFAIQCFLLSGLWELIDKFIQGIDREIFIALTTFSLMFFAVWMTFGFAVAAGALQGFEKHPSQEDKMFSESRFAITNIYVLSFDTIFLVCLQYAWVFNRT